MFEAPEKTINGRNDAPPRVSTLDSNIEKRDKKKKTEENKKIKKAPGTIFLGPKNHPDKIFCLDIISKNQLWRGGRPSFSIKLKPMIA